MKHWLSELRLRIGRFRSYSDLKEELRIHLEMQAEDNIAAGMPSSEAYRRARLRLSRTPEIFERVHDQDFVTLLENWYRDFRSGMRAIRRSPVFCITAILTLALGIGVNTAIFALLFGLLLRSLPVADPQQLAHIGLVRPTNRNSNSFSAIPYHMLKEFRREQHSFSDISIWSWNEITMLDTAGTLRAYRAGLVSGDAFSSFGMKPYLGRLIAPGDDVRGGSSEVWPVVLSYGFWSDRFAADPQIIGKQIRISNVLATAIGIAPPAFRGVWPGDDMKMYLPFQFLNILVGEDLINSPTSFFGVSAIGRLKARSYHRGGAD